jgi:hypothetical protein
VKLNQAEFADFVTRLVTRFLITVEVVDRTALGECVVVVFWNDFPQRCVEDDKIVYVQWRELAPYLEALPARLDDATRAEVTGGLDYLKHDAGATAAT